MFVYINGLLVLLSEVSVVCYFDCVGFFWYYLLQVDCINVGAGSASPNIVPQFLTLFLLSYIYFAVFLSQLFDRKKLQKLPAHGLSKSLTPLLGNSTNIPRSSLPCHLCLPFQSREQKNSLHALPASYGTHAQTLLFLFLYWNWHALLLKRCRIYFLYYLLFAVFHKHR